MQTGHRNSLGHPELEREQNFETHSRSVLRTGHHMPVEVKPELLAIFPSPWLINCSPNHLFDIFWSKYHSAIIKFYLAKYR